MICVPLNPRPLAVQVRLPVTPAAALAVARLHMAGPFVRGVRDCLFAPCDAFAALWSFNPLAAAPIAYSTLAGAVRHLRAEGGYLPWAIRTFAAAGLPEAVTPTPGSVVLLHHPKALGGAMLSLCIAPGAFAIKTETGMMITDAAVAGVWSWD